MNQHRIALLFLTITLLAANISGQRRTKVTPKAQPADTESKDAKIASLQEQIFMLNMKVLKLELKVDRDDSVDLDTTITNFHQVNSNNGSFLVKVARIEPYLNGYKVILAIGNTTTAIFNGFDLTVRWGRAYVDNSEWAKSLRTKDQHFLIDLLPGKWNEVEVILSPAKSDELGYLNLSMKTNEVSLRR